MFIVALILETMSSIDYWWTSLTTPSICIFILATTESIKDLSLKNLLDRRLFTRSTGSWTSKSLVSWDGVVAFFSFFSFVRHFANQKEAILLKFGRKQQDQIREKWREKDFQRTFRKLNDKLHELDMEWIHIFDSHILQKKSSDIEEYRQDLDKVQ